MMVYHVYMLNFFWIKFQPTSSKEEEDYDYQKPMLVIVRNPGLLGHEDKTRSNISRKGFNLTSFKQNNKVSSSKAFFSDFLKAESKRIIPQGGEEEKKALSMIGQKELVIAKRDFSLVPSTMESTTNNSKSVTTPPPHRVILKGSLQIEPIFSQLV